MTEDISKRTKRAAGWNSLSHGIKQVSDFLFGIILARILFPEDFGIMSMALICNEFAMTFSQLGTAAAIIQRKEIDKEHLSTAFTTNVILSCLICVALILISNFVGRFFNNLVVAKVLSVMSSIFVINAFNVIPYALLVRELKFKRLAIVDIISGLIFGIMATISALYGLRVWSIVVGSISSIMVSAILMNTVGEWGIYLGFSRRAFKDLFSFGGLVTGVSIMEYLSGKVDQLIIGKILGAAMLGFYTRALNLAYIPVVQIGILVSKVLFSAFSRIQDDLDRIYLGYLKAVRLVGLVCLPFLTGMAILASEFVSVVYGEKWMPAVAPLQIMCIAGFLRSIVALNGTVLGSTAKVRILIYAYSFYLFVFFLLIVACVKYGLNGCAYAVVLSAILMFVLMGQLLKSSISIKWRDIFSAIAPAAWGCLIMGIVVSIYKETLKMYFSCSPLFILFSAFIVGVFSYTGFFWVTRIKSVDALVKEFILEPLLKINIKKN
jgi:PST family polysaccharide transporter